MTLTEQIMDVQTESPSPHTPLLLLGGLFLATLLAIWLSHGNGVVRDDPERNIFIPKILTIPLQLQVAFNDQDILFRYRWPADRPHITMDMLRFNGEQWVRHGASPVGPEPDGQYEDRVTMLVDDGHVPEFGLFGGYITAAPEMRFMTGAAAADEVAGHPHLGNTLRATDVRKFLPATRSESGDWRTLVDPDALKKQREAGYFLDLWHWRAHRSNPIGWADDQFVAEHRLNDEGRSPYKTNQDPGTGLPLLMFAADLTGFHALRWESVQRYPPAEPVYFLAESHAVPFDPTRDWQDGDTLPRQLLQQPSGSRASIRTAEPTRWQDGYWDVTLIRALDTGNPLDDKIFRDQGIYDIAIAVHRDASGSRWHYVSLPLKLGLSRDATIPAQRFDGARPDWDRIPANTLTLFYPGQVDFASLLDRAHAGAEAMKDGVPVHRRHSEHQLALYGIEREFRQPILRQWWLTLTAGVVLFLCLGLSLWILHPTRENRS
jgi:hypothetical protein